jgi:hypothetical protein
MELGYVSAIDSECEQSGLLTHIVATANGSLSMPMKN